MKATKITKEKYMDLKHFITFFFQGSIKRTCSVNSNELSEIKVPQGAYGFRVFDRATDDIVRNGKKIVSKNDLLNDNTYYIGKVLSLEDIKKEFGDEVYNEMITKSYYGAVKSPDNYLAPLALNNLVNILSAQEVTFLEPEREAE